MSVPRGTPPKKAKATGGVTISDVARAAGVAPMTVSRALNQPAQVRPDTLARVRAAIEQTGYVPNRVAGTLASNRSQLVAVIVPILTNPVFSDFFQAITDRLNGAGYQVLLGISGYDASREQELLDVILGRRPDGIILTGTVHTDGSRRRLRAIGVPVVETWDLAEAPLDMLVGFSHETVGQHIATDLLARGHRRFATMTVDDPRGTRRIQSTRDALQQHGVGQIPHLALNGVPTLALGREGLRRLLDETDLDTPLTLICSSDTLAHGVLTEAAARGIGVPRPLAVMGFGDMNFAAHTHPPLSTVRIDGAAMGDAAAGALLQRLMNGEHEGKTVDIGFALVDRGTLDP